MKIVRETNETITTNKYNIEDSQYGLIIYIEYVNNKGEVFDYALRDVEGNNIDNPALLEKVQECVENNPNIIK